MEWLSPRPMLDPEITVCVYAIRNIQTCSFCRHTPQKRVFQRVSFCIRHEGNSQPTCANSRVGRQESQVKPRGLETARSVVLGIIWALTYNLAYDLVRFVKGPPDSQTSYSAPT